MDHSALMSSRSLNLAIDLFIIVFGARQRLQTVHKDNTFNDVPTLHNLSQQQLLSYQHVRHRFHLTPNGAWTVERCVRDLMWSFGMSRCTLEPR
jgi:hypothetical protein